MSGIVRIRRRKGRRRAKARRRLFGAIDRLHWLSAEVVLESTAARREEGPLVEEAVETATAVVAETVATVATKATAEAAAEAAAEAVEVAQDHDFLLLVASPDEADVHDVKC
ncbi:hypothetical protein [Actinomadura craniellae]|uniref:hypothetical protein n=1 Tax=Actinomadura craniellae TaxID=2231787 RepID=UPI0018F151F5|nr:hypothetical protein [Actinomadura craniellae]